MLVAHANENAILQLLGNRQVIALDQRDGFRLHVLLSRPTFCHRGYPGRHGRAAIGNRSAVFASYSISGGGFVDEYLGRYEKVHISPAAIGSAIAGLVVEQTLMTAYNICDLALVGNDFKMNAMVLAIDVTGLSQFILAVDLGSLGRSGEGYFREV
ncbi:hypothetical protein SB5_18250 [Pseudomonas oryzihabitans]|nr:hypothetical protein SB5_18250 [Pseudomonas psychrotolerans]